MEKCYLSLFLISSLTPKQFLNFLGLFYEEKYHKKGLARKKVAVKGN